MVTGHNYSPLLILSVMSPFQTVLFKIFFLFFFGINYHDKWMQFHKTYRYEEQIEKKIFNKHENNYTSKVEKRFIVNDFFYHDSH